MTYSVYFSAATVLTAALLLFLTVRAFRCEDERDRLKAFFAPSLTQSAATVLTAGFVTALLFAVPVSGPAGTLFESLIQALGAGLPEAGASAPFALTDTSGEALRHAGKRFHGISLTLHFVKISLVAAIAGGVTSFAAMLITGSVIAARNRISFPDGIQRLKNFYWRPAMLTGIFLWMLFTWLMMVWTDWHVLGTLANGRDTLASLFSWFACASLAGIWLLAGSFLFAKKKA